MSAWTKVSRPSKPLPLPKKRKIVLPEALAQVQSRSFSESSRTAAVRAGEEAKKTPAILQPKPKARPRDHGRTAVLCAAGALGHVAGRLDAEAGGLSRKQSGPHYIQQRPNLLSLES